MKESQVKNTYEKYKEEIGRVAFFKRVNAKKRK